jgi:hypothetical protein
LYILNGIASDVAGVHPAACFGVERARGDLAVCVSARHVDEVEDDLGVAGGDDGLGEDTCARSF